MERKLVTPPATEPLTLDEVKLHLRVDLDEDDSLIVALIQTAREEAEFLIGQRLITQTWELVLSAAERVSLEGLLPISNISGTGLYRIDGHWPGQIHADDHCTLQIVCGFGEAKDVPEAIKAWMKLRIGALYLQRESLQVDSANPVLTPYGFADGLLDAWRIPRV